MKTSFSGTSRFATIIGKCRRGVRAHESSCIFLDFSDGVHRIPPNCPRPADCQQPLSFGRIPRSASRIFPCRHVHTPGEAPTKTCFDCTFHRTIPAELGHSPRKPLEAKAVIQTCRLEAGDLACSSWCKRLIATVGMRLSRRSVQVASGLPQSPSVCRPIWHASKEEYRVRAPNPNRTYRMNTIRRRETVISPRVPPGIPDIGPRQ